MPLILDYFPPENHKPSIMHSEVPPQRYAFLGNRALRFQKDAVNTTYYQGLWSPSYNHTGMTVDIIWTSYGTGVAAFGISLARYQFGVTLITTPPTSGLFGTEQTVNSTVPTAYSPIRATISFADAAVTHLPLEFYRVRVRHLGLTPANISEAVLVLGIVLSNAAETPVP